MNSCKPALAAASRGCSVLVTPSNLLHLNNHHSARGLTVFCHKDDAADPSPGKGVTTSSQEELDDTGGENDPDSKEEDPAPQS